MVMKIKKEEEGERGWRKIAKEDQNLKKVEAGRVRIGRKGLGGGGREVKEKVEEE